MIAVPARPFEVAEAADSPLLARAAAKQPA